MAFKQRIRLLDSRALSERIRGFACHRLCCDLRLENGTLRYIHSQCSTVPSLLAPRQHGQGGFTLEQKWSVTLPPTPPTESHPTRRFFSPFCECLHCPTEWSHDHLTNLISNITVVGFNRNDCGNATWIGLQLPSWNSGHTLWKDSDIRWGGHSILWGFHFPSDTFVVFVKLPINPNSSLIQDKADINWHINTILKVLTQILGTLQKETLMGNVCKPQSLTEEH